MKLIHKGFSNEVGIFEKAKEAKYKMNFVLISLIGLTLVIVTSVIGGSIGLVLYQARLIGPVTQFIVFNLVLNFLLLIGAVWLVVTKIEKRRFKDIGFEKHNSLKKYVRGFQIGIILMSLCTLVMYLGGGITIVRGINKPSNYIVIVFLTLIGWIVQGAGEEILCRGWMLSIIGKRYNVIFAVVVTSIMFTVLHGLNSSISYIALVNLFIYGVFAALYVVWEKGLWGVCGFHSAWNWMQGNILGIEVSGNRVVGGSLINLKAVGNPLLSGNGFGVEGSIVCTIILLVGILLLIKMILKN